MGGGGGFRAPRASAGRPNTLKLLKHHALAEQGLGFTGRVCRVYGSVGFVGFIGFAGVYRVCRVYRGTRGGPG